MKKLLVSLLKRMRLYYPLLIYLHLIKNSLRSYQYRLLSTPQKEGGFICNFCGARYKKFIDDPVPEKYSINTRLHVVAGYCANCICPDCLSTSRERLVKICLENILMTSGKKVLHFAPEKKIHGLLHNALLTSVDIEPQLYKHVDRWVQYADATQLPFKDEAFDAIIANHILEHIPNDMQAIKEIHRVLKRGGKALLQVPYSAAIKDTAEDPFIHDSVLGAQLFGQEDHVRIYAFDDYCNRLQNASFTVHIYGEDFLRPFAQYALQPGEVLVIGEKL